jgi:superfamily II DNA or RNA helicase
MFMPIYKAALELVGNDKSKIIIDDESKKMISAECKPLDGIFDDNYEIEELDRPFRYYQIDAVRKLLKYGKGICVSATGSGKSYIIASLINELRNNADKIDELRKRPRFLVIVPTRQLVDQMYKDFTKYGLHGICKWTSNSGKKRDGNFEDNSCKDGFEGVIITNHKWICDHVKRQSKSTKTDKNPKITFPLKDIGCIIADEVHTVGYKTKILKLVEKINPKIRFGFTGTLPKFVFNRWVIMGSFGIPLYTAEIKKLQDEGFLSKIKIQPVKCVVSEIDKNRDLLYSVNHRLKLGDRLPDGTIIDTSTAFKMEHEFFEANSEELYSPVFDKIIEMFDVGNKNMIVLFDRLSIGKKIYDMLSEKLHGKSNVHYIDGSIDVADRERIRSSLETTSGNVLVAQAVTASVGLNIRNLNGIAFAFAGKSFVRVIQSIGRVIRLKDDGSTSTLFEIYFNTRYSEQHHREKMDILKAQYGDECIMPDEVIRI